MGEVLKDIARQMWAEAERDGRSSRTLAGGLFIVCNVVDDERKLGLCRPGGRVLFDEAAIARAHFSVPALHQYEEIPYTSGLWRIYTWCLPTSDQLSLFDSPAEWGEVTP